MSSSSIYLSIHQSRSVQLSSYLPILSSVYLSIYLGPALFAGGYGQSPCLSWGFLYTHGSNLLTRFAKNTAQVLRDIDCEISLRCPQLVPQLPARL